MNILIVERACDGTVGGSHTCLYNIVKRLNKDEFKTTIVVYQYNAFVEKMRSAGVEVLLFERKPHLNGHFIIRKLKNWYTLICMHKMRLTQLLLIRDINLVVLNNSIAGSSNYVAVSKILNIPVIAYERGYFRYTESDLRLTSQISASIAVSHSVHRNMVLQQYSAKTEVVYDGLPIETGFVKSKLIVTQTKKIYDLPEDSVVIGIIGNIKKWKGQEYFVRAFNILGKMYKNLHGLIVGGYGTEDEEYVIKIKEIAKNSEVNQRLHFLGFRDDVPDLLSIMDVFIHASIKPEPFGMVLLEAMSHRIPVIATNMGGPVEILLGGECGILVPPKNELAIVHGVVKYFEEEDFRKNMIEKSYARVRNVFDINMTVKNTSDIFKEVCCAGRQN